MMYIRIYIYIYIYTNSYLPFSRQKHHWPNHPLLPLICAWLHIHAKIHVHVWVYKRIYIYTQVRLYIHTYICVNVYVCMYGRICMNVCMFVCMFVCTYVCMYECICIGTSLRMPPRLTGSSCFLCLYVCICIYVSRFSSILNVFICVSTHSHTIWIYTCLYMYICIYVCMYVCMYVWLWYPNNFFSFLSLNLRLGPSVPPFPQHIQKQYIHTYIHTYTYTAFIHTHTGIHTEIQGRDIHCFKFDFWFFGIWNSASFVVLLDIFSWKKPHTYWTNKSSNKTTN